MIPSISEKDYQKLNQVLDKTQAQYKKFLKNLMAKFRKVKEHEIQRNTVRLNSVVEFWHSILRKIVKIKIVLPAQANLRTKNISFFSPISIALIGHTENDLVTLPGPGVQKRIRIIKVTNNP